MFSGKRAFDGPTPADTASAILKEDPADLLASNPKITPALNRIVLHCWRRIPRNVSSPRVTSHSTCIHSRQFQKPVQRRP